MSNTSMLASVHAAAHGEFPPAGDETANRQPEKEGQMSDPKNPATEPEAAAGNPEKPAEPDKPSAAEPEPSKPEPEKGPGTEAKGESQEEIEQRVRAEQAERHKQIVGLCALAGMPDKAAKYVASDKTPAQVQSELLKARAEAGGDEVIARHPNAEPSTTDGWDRAFAKVANSKAA